MPVPTSITELSQTAGSNSPAGTDNVSTADDHIRALAAFIAQLRDGEGFATEATVASAATCNIGGANSLVVQITGTTTITSFGTDYLGPRFVRFAGALTLTHNSTSLILPGAANITTAAGDTAIFVPQTAGWRCVSYTRAAGAPAFSASNCTTSIPNATVTTVIFPNEAFDTASCYNTSTGRFTPTTPGYYQINVWVSWGSSTVANKSINLQKNGTSFATMSFSTSDTNPWHVPAVSGLVYLNGSTDYVSAAAYISGGGPASLTDGGFSGVLVRHA